ncbi:hypothetical protein MTO96_004000 [Rhipicephalus appendiculatus]
MASASADARTAERRKQLLVGELPGDFLRVDSTPTTGSQSQISVDEQTAIALQQQLSGAAFTTAQAVGRLSISVIQAKLVKNYGLFHCFLSPGVTAFLVEIYDETVDIWHPLSGRQGESKEGNINLVLSYQAIPPGSLAAPPVVLVNTPYMMPGVVQYPAAAGYVYPPYTVPVARPGVVAAGPGYNPALQPAAQQQPAPVPITEEDVKQVQEMFPEMDAEVVKGVLESHRGNKDAAVNALLAMNDATA